VNPMKPIIGVGLLVSGSIIAAAIVVRAGSPQDSDAPSSTEVFNELTTMLGQQNTDLDEQTQLHLLIRAAGHLGDTMFVSVLRGVSDEFSEGRQRLLALEALNSLWLLGEPREYFAGHVDHFAERPSCAYYAILVLAREPNSDFMDRLNQIYDLVADQCELADANLIHSGIMDARLVYRVQSMLESAQTVEEKVDILAQHATTPYMIGPAAGDSLVELMHPVVGWARERLHALGEADPESVAEAVCSAQLDSLYGPEGAWSGSGVSEERLTQLRARHKAKLAELLPLQAQDALAALDGCY